MLRFGSMATALVLTLAACGSTTEERGISGAGIGAAGGSVVGAVTGLTVVEGALIGAGVGGLTGAFSDEEKLNLGDPIWKRSSGSSTTQTSSQTTTDPRLVRDIQSGLSDMGYDPGPVDGVMGPKTATAIRQYQSAHGLLADGRPSQELALHIQQRTASLSQ